MKRKSTDRLLVFLGIILFFLVLSYGFFPQVLGGKIVNQSDFSGWRGMAQETMQHNSQHPDDPTYWTNSMFGGMPNVTMYDDFKGDWTKNIYKVLLSGARPANYLFISLLGGFLLMLACGVNGILAVGGAIAITFCSYNMQIIQVGHNTKMQAIAFMPWVLAALIFTYRSALASAGKKKFFSKALLGSSLFAIALSLQIKANHPQITYYLAIIILVYALVLLIHILIREREKTARFFTVSVLLLAIGCIGIATNLNKLIPTYSYTQYTMRGGSELEKTSEHDNGKGLDLDYATAWSYGIEETPNLLIPNFNGGASAGEMKKDNSETYRLLQQAGQSNLDQVMKSLPLYWGPQPFTAGPMYLGAVTVFLFILGILLYDRKEKWWILAVSLLAILLAWGSHFMWFTKLWFEHVPMYNKFRTVSMALVILQITVPVLGFISLDRILKRQTDSARTWKAAWTAYAIAGGFCLLFVLFPSLAGTFRGSADAGMQEILSDALAADRKTLLVKDAFRSFLFISMAFALIIWWMKSRSGETISRKAAAASAAVALIVFIDLGTVDRRYLNSDDFVSNSSFASQFKARPVDNMILEDTALDYRVLDVSVNTFNDAHPSFHHKCIGGYSPAKMQRYQDLIERYLSGEINSIIRTVNSSATIQDVEANLPYLPVTSALNGKYIIIGGDYPPVVNSRASGNCWFVDHSVTAPTPDDEIDLIGTVDLGKTAVIGNDFAWAAEKIESLKAESDSSYMLQSANDTIYMTSYAPNSLEYYSRTSAERVVIFSEIYYPEGWHAEVDGKPLELFRADWILRGAVIPSGEHKITMRFDPESYTTGERLSRASSIFLILLLIASGALSVSACRKRPSSV